MKKNVIVLGATGSIGTMCINAIISSSSLKLVAISGYKNKKKLEEIKKNFAVPFSASFEETAPSEFIKQLRENYDPFDTIAINAIDGFDGLLSSIEVVNNGFNLILANKETIVSGGDIFLNHAKNKGVQVRSIDSEMYALESLIKAFGKENISEYIITASGGPFVDLLRNELTNIKYDNAVKHPTWKMGKRISLNSATLLNKAYEMIEAAKLFNIPPNKIRVLINKESHVHSLVKLNNGVIYPQMYPPTQMLAINEVLGIETNTKLSTYPQSFSLNFEEPSFDRFPFLKLAYECIDNHAKAVMFNAAGEKADKLFEMGNIRFDQIEEYVSIQMHTHQYIKINDYKDIYKINNAIKHASVNICS